MQMSGRRVIKSSVPEVTRDNVIEVLYDALDEHKLNRAEIDYLYKYYKGEQPIRKREKKTRKDIVNRIVENRANQIVSFKTGYFCGEPIQYVSRKTEKHVVDDVNWLNDLMFAEDKASKDQSLVEWMHIAGVGYRLVLPDKPLSEDEAPFEIYTLDPRDTFVIYSTDIDERPLAAVKYVTDTVTGEVIYSIYTDRSFFTVKSLGADKVEEQFHTIGMIPIIEYPANNARLGAFEIVLPLLDALNDLDSNRMDSVGQFVQSFLKFINCEIDSEQYEEFLKRGAIMIKSTDGTNADVDMVSQELNQTQTQTLKDDLYSSILTICGMPNRNGGSSTSDTGQAVIMRDGWSDAEARAKDTENVFSPAEKRTMKLVLRICRAMSDREVYLKDIDIRYTRRNYENIQMKSQVLISMLQNDKIHPLIAYQSSGMFPDSQNAYQMGMQYYEESKSVKTPLDDTENLREEDKTQE